MKKAEKDSQRLTTMKRAEEYGYKIKKVVMTYATCWWVWKPGVVHFGFVKSEELALQMCDGHLKRSLG